MPQARRPPLRVPAALALLIYALVVLAGPALMHEFACSGHGAPHCLVCASVQSVSSAAEAPVLLASDSSDAGRVHLLGTPCDGTLIVLAAVDRAPPALL